MGEGLNVFNVQPRAVHGAQAWLLPSGIQVLYAHLSTTIVIRERTRTTKTNCSYLIRILILMLTPLQTNGNHRRSDDTTGDHCTKPVELAGILTQATTVMWKLAPHALPLELNWRRERPFRRRTRTEGRAKAARTPDRAPALLC